MNKGDTQQVLDHGYVKFIDSMGTDETVIEAARMSTGKGFEGWGGKEQCRYCGVGRAHGIIECAATSTGHDFVPNGEPGDEKLLDYLYRNKHMTPFEMCELAIEVQAPIFVFREWMRHRSQSYNEMSARYTQMPNLHYVPHQGRFSSKKSDNKQESSAPAISSARDESWQYVAKIEQDKIYFNYEEMLCHGVPKEVARINTPVSRYSRMRAKTDLRNWLGFLNLRMRENAQWEIRQYAVAVANIIREIWPRTYELFLNYDLNATVFSAQELETLLLWMREFGAGRGNAILVQTEIVSVFHGTASQKADFRKKLGLK